MFVEFNTPTRILFGPGCSGTIASEAIRFGKVILLVTGKTARIHENTGLAFPEGTSVTRVAVSGEPTVELITQGVATARNTNAEVVVGIGGGSVIDTAKAIAALVKNPGAPIDYLEVIGKGQALSHESLACIAVPTTAGTGSEVTKNAVLLSAESRVKVSLRGQFLFPQLAIVDPALTVSLGRELTASTGGDALTQCIEAFISCKATPFSDMASSEGIVRAVRSLPRACSDGSDLVARTDLSMAALLSGIALANSGLGAVHGFAAVIGGLCGIAHGVICALLLPPVLAEVVKAVTLQNTDSLLQRKLRTLAGIMSENRTQEPQSINDSLSALYEELETALPPPGTITIDRALFPSIVSGARNASSMKGSPVPFSDEVLFSILEKAF